ncbi:MAG: SURF1 family protein [Proteobacteria bacterium]|nr:SURF1 family protein [Pseudomonadota bacterium]
MSSRRDRSTPSTPGVHGLAALFAALGAWQLRRGAEKQAMLDAAGQVTRDRAARPLAAAGDPGRADAYDWAAGAGRFDARGPLWLDNQQRNGRVGVRVYRIFHPDDGAPLLVDLGWLPLEGTREMPVVERPAGTLELRGLLTPPPSAGLALGNALVREDGAWLMMRLETDAITRAAELPVPLAPRVLRLDPAVPLGFDRDLELLANTLPPAKHRGYAVQWFGLALTVLVTALVLTFRRSSRAPRR